MRISLDLDGVIADGERWFYAIADGVIEIDPLLSERAELAYYASRGVKHHPSYFLNSNDKGFIITARKSRSCNVTIRWLKQNNIVLPVYFVDEKDEADWNDYGAASEIVARLKTNVIRSLGIELHLDNNPIIVNMLRSEGINALQIGNEFV